MKHDYTRLVGCALASFVPVCAIRFGTPDWSSLVPSSSEIPTKNFTMNRCISSDSKLSRSGTISTGILESHIDRWDTRYSQTCGQLTMVFLWMGPMCKVVTSSLVLYITIVLVPVRYSRTHWHSILISRWMRPRREGGTIGFDIPHTSQCQRDTHKLKGFCLWSLSEQDLPMRVVPSALVH